MKTYATLAALGLAAVPANAFFLMPCWPVSTQRVDPIVDPGLVSTHVHQIAGGDGFKPNMSYADTQAASCTTCFVKGDHSNYWIPALYMKHQDGTFERVNQVGSASMYYFNEPSRLGAGEKMETFPKGLRMLAGDPDKRSGGTDFESQAINYKCLNYAGTPTDSKTFPTGNCPDGVRAEVTYPSCWDGKNLDSADHKSHMSYPTGTFESGACPSTHPHHLVTLKVEFIFDTNSFKGQWYGNSQPFVWANGDSTGYGLHADYVMGWDYDLLSSAVAQCFDEYGVLANCAPFSGKIQSAYTNPGTCKVDSFVDEDVGGVIKAMPGCNAIQAGPSAAVKANCNDQVKLLGNWANAAVDDSSNDSTYDNTAASAPAASAPAASAPAASESFYVTTVPIYSHISAPTAPSAAAPAPSSSKSDYQWSALGGAFFGSSSPSPAAAQPTPSAGNAHIVTVTDIITHTTYTTEWSNVQQPSKTADAVVAVSSAAASAAPSTPSWGKWRREIGDDIHKHHLRHLRYRRRAAIKAEQEHAHAVQPEY